MRILAILIACIMSCKMIPTSARAQVQKHTQERSQTQAHQQLQTKNIQQFITKVLQEYPEARLLDIYKSCFQDYMGAEHLVSDRQRVKNYLDEELNSLETNGLMDWLYEPCGIEGKYAISHSPQYRNTYHPHYRIIERTIFEKEIKPLLTH